MIGGKMIGHRPISTSQHHPGAQRRQLRTGAIEAEQGQRGHGGRKPGKGMNLATSPQNECENRRRRPSRGLAHTPGTPIFALFRWTSERAASIRCPDGGSGQGSFASFLKGPLPPSGHRIERGTIDLQSDINCLPERSLLGAFGKQHDDYYHDVFNSAGSTLATPPILVQRMGSTSIAVNSCTPRSAINDSTTGFKLQFARTLSISLSRPRTRSSVCFTAPTYSSSTIC